MDTIQIANLGVLADLDISCFTGSRTDRETSEYVADNLANHNSKECGKYIKNLFGNCKDLMKIRSCAQSLRLSLKGLSLPYPVGGFRLVPNRIFPEFTQEYTRGSEAMESLVEVFKNNYEQNVEYARQQQRSLFREEDIPPKNTIDQYFTCSLNIQPVPSTNDFDRLLGLDNAVTLLKSSIDLQNKRAIQDSVESLRDRMIDIVNVASDRLRDYNPEVNRYYKSWLNNIVDMANLVDKLNIFNNQSLSTVTEMARDICTVNHESLKVDGVLAHAKYNELQQILRTINATSTTS